MSATLVLLIILAVSVAIFALLGWILVKADEKDQRDLKRKADKVLGPEARK